MSTSVTASGLSKHFGEFKAVHDLSFELPRGGVTGFVGPNGSGKSTTIRMLLGLIRPTAGTATVLGQPVENPAAYIHRVGALVEAPTLYPKLSGRKNLQVLAQLGSLPNSRIDEVLDIVDLAERSGDKFEAYSLGMKQRLGIAAALLQDPDLLILDEPTNGLDPLGMQDIRRLIGQIAAEGRTIVVSSHLLSELVQVCDWLIVIDHGGLVYLGHPDDLTGTESIVARPVEANDLPALRTVGTSTGLAVTSTGSEIVVTLDDSADPGAVAAQINRDAHAAGINLLELHHRRDDLEARYLDLLANHSISKGPTS